MKQKLWVLTFVLALLRRQLDFFHGKIDREGTFKTERAASISTSINLVTSHSLMYGSLECFPCDLMEEPNLYQHLDSQFYSIGIYIYPYANATLFLINVALW